MIAASIFYIFYEVLAIITFAIINDRITPTSPEFLNWSKNFTNGGCGVMDMTNSLHNACLNSCGFLTGPFFIYIFTVYRNKVMPFDKNTSKIKVQDSQIFNGCTKTQISKISLIRILLYALANIILLLPTQYVKLDDVGSPIGIMFINVVFPMIVVAYLIFGGTYDFVLSKFTS